MSRTKGSFGPRTKEAIRKAGLELIHRHGYEAMSLRQLADKVGIQQGSLYNHINAKQDLLFLLMREHLETLNSGLDATLADKADPVTQMKAFIAFHLTYHMERPREVYINNSELRSLEPGNLRKINALRYAYERRVIDIIQAGVTAKKFKAAEPKVAAFAIIALLTGICNWYKSNGRLGKTRLVKIHTDLVLHGLADA